MLAATALAASFLALPALAEDGVADARPTIRGQVVGGFVAPHVYYGDLRDLPVEPDWEAGDPYIVNPRRWRGTVPETPWAPMRRDPLLDVQASVTRGPGATTQIHSFEGLDTGAQPPDTTGDVGVSYFIHSVNASTYAIYDKVTGAQVAGPFAIDSLGTGACANGAGDPIVLYDEMAGRWMISEFSGSANALCVYVSMTADPIAGGWCNYQFNTPGFPDYPHYAVWPDGYYVTTNQGARIYALDRANMIACGTARPMQQFQAPGLPGLGFQAFTPSDVDGPPPPAGAPAYMMRHRDTELGNQGPNLPSNDILEIWSLALDWVTPGNSVLTQLPDIIVSEFDSNLCPPINFFSCIPQPGTNTRLDPLLEVIMYRLTYRNFGGHETLVGVLQTDIGDFQDHSGERWFELRKTGMGNWVLHQEGTYSPDAEHRFMGTIGMDKRGNILLGYALSSTTTNPSVRYTGRLATDPLGTMTEPETSLVVGSGFNSSIRFGDYSQMGVDPVDGCTFWFTIEYTEGNANAANRIGAVRFDSCLTVPVFTDGFESGNTSAWSFTTP